MTFWSNVAYVKNGQKVKAEQALRELSAWDTQSQDNLYLLQATGALLSDDLDTASMFFSRGKNYSYLLDPLAKTVSYILKAKGVRRLSNSSEVNFYLEKLFGLKEETPDTVSYRAPIPDPLRERIDGKRAPTPVAASSVAPSTHVPSPAPSPKSHSSGFLGILAVIAVVVAIVIFVPKNKKDNTPQTPAETIITSNTPAQSAPASTEVSKSTPAKTTSGNKGSSSNSSSGTTQITSNPDKASSSGGAATTSTNTSNSSSVGASSGQTQTQPSAPSQAKTDPVAELKAAAEGGNKDAQYELGMKYYDGNGVSKNYATAFQYLKPLADAGYTKAYFPVAEMYHGGRGVAKDRDAAEAWYTKAANAGNAKAKSILLNSF